MDLSGRIFVTSDTHFGETAICRRFGRDFHDVESMNERLVDEINSVVGADDTLLHLGDFVGSTDDSRSRLAASIRARIDCSHIILVRGNHDPVGRNRFDTLFDSLHDRLSFKLPVPGDAGEQVRLVLSHFPLQVWQGRHAGSLHLYGHTHGTIEEQGRSTDIGVDCWGLRPQRLDRIVEMLCGRPIGFERVRPQVQPSR